MHSIRLITILILYDRAAGSAASADTSVLLQGNLQPANLDDAGPVPETVAKKKADLQAVQRANGDLYNGSYPSATRDQEAAFRDKLSDLAEKYGLHAWYDIASGHYVWPHLSSLFHLHAPSRKTSKGMPMTLTYPSHDADPKYKEQYEADFQKRGLASFVPSSLKSVEDVREFVSSPGHFVVTANVPSEYGYTWYPDDRESPFTWEQAIILEHGVDEARHYGVGHNFVENTDCSRKRPPLSFTNFLGQNMYSGGELSKADLVALAGFTDASKPLLIFMTGADIEVHHWSVLFALLPGSSQCAPLFDVKELERLQDTYNIILRPHPHMSIASDAESVRSALQELKGVYLDMGETALGIEFTSLYHPADVLVLELSGTSTSAMVAAADKPIVLARRTEHDQKLLELGDQVITDDMVSGWRPQNGESLTDAVERAVSTFSDKGVEMERLRMEHASRFFCCDFDGFEEYKLMIGILSGLPIREPSWSEDLESLKTALSDIQAQVGTSWPDKPLYSGLGYIR